nr:MAG TPA_asm: Transcriptional regulator, RHH-like, CopG [Caudoviricetes sp.]
MCKRGRKPMPDKHLVGVTFDGDTYATLAAVCDVIGTPIATYVRNIVSRALACEDNRPNISIEASTPRTAMEFVGIKEPTPIFPTSDTRPITEVLLEEKERDGGVVEEQKEEAPTVNDDLDEQLAALFGE